MRAILLDSMPEVARCMTEKIMTYALGRGIEPYDKRAVDQIQKNLAADGYRFQTLIHEVVTSLPFQSRRGESAAHPKQIVAEQQKEITSK
jgi:hypothetical protein